MSETKLAKAHYGQTIQAFPLTNGDKCNITGGAATGVVLIHCVADGAITVTFSDTTQAVLNLVEGDDYAFPGGASVAFTSGSYHIA